MDISTALVDLLRNSKEEAILNQGGPLAKPAQPGLSNEMAAAATHLRDPEYTVYRREAEANGEPVMSLEEFQLAKSGSR